MRRSQDSGLEEVHLLHCLPIASRHKARGHAGDQVCVFKACCASRQLPRYPKQGDAAARWMRPVCWKPSTTARCVCLSPPAQFPACCERHPPWLASASSVKKFLSRPGPKGQTGRRKFRSSGASSQPPLGHALPRIETLKRHGERGRTAYWVWSRLITARLCFLLGQTVDCEPCNVTCGEGASAMCNDTETRPCRTGGCVRGCHLGVSERRRGGGMTMIIFLVKHLVFCVMAVSLFFLFCPRSFLPFATTTTTTTKL